MAWHRMVWDGRGMSVLEAGLATARDTMTVYYFVYLVAVILSLQFEYVTPFLLLDYISLSTTLQGVLGE